MDYLFIGCGLSAMSAAFFLQPNTNIDKIILLEKESVIGGLCRSFRAKDLVYDVGPHVFFSKNKEVLSFLHQILNNNRKKIRRSNRILYKDKRVQFPFENDLSELPSGDRNYCANTFFVNPYENFQPNNLLQYFLKTFGEGITNLYLRPYNEKIWKFDPSFMDTQMVERIPKPTNEDILRSANGETVDGYLHQLYFEYPKTGGTEALIHGLRSNLNSKVSIVTNAEVKSVNRDVHGAFSIQTTQGTFTADKIISTIPANEFTKMYNPCVPANVLDAAKQLRYNSIIIAIANVSVDCAGDNFAFMVADKNIIFHRISKIDFLGDTYSIPGTTTYMAEITYRKDDMTAALSDREVGEFVMHGLVDIKFVDNFDQVNFIEIKRFEYAYVIYDLMHRKNMDIILDYFKSEGVGMLGRFGSFEYLNMDAVVEQAQNYVKSLKIFYV